MLRVLATGYAEPSRFGFAVGRDVGSAVVRNRVKRRLREAVSSLPVASGWNAVIRAKPRAADVTFWNIRAELSALFAGAGMLSAGEAS